MTRSVTLMALLAMIWTSALAPVGPASADGASCSEFTNVCTIVDQDPGSDPTTPPPSKRVPPSSSDKPKYPLCSSFRGGSVVALPGTPVGDLPVDTRPKSGWVRSTCLEGQELMWVQNPARTTYGPATIRAGGISLTAKVELIEWDMGNGAVVRCRNHGTEWFDGMGMKQSPTCGYMYVKQGHYTVRATAHWVARWSGYGQSGAIPLSLTASRALEIGELQVIITR